MQTNIYMIKYARIWPIGPSIVYTRYAVVDQSCILNSENIFKSIFGIDASQLYPFSMCQQMPTGLNTSC